MGNREAVIRVQCRASEHPIVSEMRIDDGFVVVHDDQVRAIDAWRDRHRVTVNHNGCALREDTILVGLQQVATRDGYFVIIQLRDEGTRGGGYLGPR